MEVRLTRGTRLVELDTYGSSIWPPTAPLAKDLAAAEKELAGTTAKLGDEAFSPGLRRKSSTDPGTPTGRSRGSRPDHDKVGIPDRRPRPDPGRVASLLQVEHLLDQRHRNQLEPSTGHVSTLIELLGSPRRRYPSIHVAGTNGRTSWPA